MSNKNWKLTEINVEDVPEFGTIRVVFEKTNDCPEIKKTVAGCTHCTQYSYQGNQLHVQIKLGQIPVHLKSQKKIPFNKVISVYYKNGNLDVLKVKGNKIPKK